MKDKINNVWKVVILIVLVIGIVIAVIGTIKSLFEEKDLLTSEELVLYTVTGNLVKDYNTYYYVEDCMENLLEGCERQLYDQMYDLYLKDYRKESKNDTIDLIKSQLMGKQYKVKDMYNINDTGILVRIDIDNKTVNILFVLNTKEGASYNFALID